ncbi:MAG TPA: LytTR family DNA-binding domain-containing protein [Cyclobacteriaceae bacterium]|nr:LytTR family DNA-binding domain-containing protein [Cyclobacteriaceae bacterium]
MKVLIIEDELLAQAKLESMLRLLDPSVEVLAKLTSVKESLLWFSKNQSPDVAFVDIQLSDDHSFEIFRNQSITCPVIFTTAYDKFLLESFEFNSIDYLLKPITESKLKRALNKVRNLEQHFIQNKLESLTSNSPKRILVKKGGEIISLQLDDVAYIFTDHKITFIKDTSGRQFILDKTLSELELDLDTKKFFRINRKYIAHIQSIEKFKSDNGKIKLYMKPEIKEEVHVSKENAPLFRNWMEKP